MSDTPVIHNIIHLNGESTDVPSRRDPFLGLERERHPRAALVTAAQRHEL